MSDPIIEDNDFLSSSPLPPWLNIDYKFSPVPALQAATAAVSRWASQPCQTHNSGFHGPPSLSSNF